MDFLGHGNSDRLNEFPSDLWFSQAMQAAAVLDALDLRNVNVLGTSGGALAALNLALERPDLAGKVIVDSFEGENALDAVAAIIAAERTQAKTDPESVSFWQACLALAFLHIFRVELVESPSLFYMVGR
jgi:pimeloyl-ACP methyl ester carboxylesterase